MKHSDLCFRRKFAERRTLVFQNVVPFEGGLMRRVFLTMLEIVRFKMRDMAEPFILARHVLNIVPVKISCML